MMRKDRGERSGGRPLPGPSGARFAAPYLAVGIVLMAAAFGLTRFVEPLLGPGLAAFAPALSILLVFGAAFLLFRLREARREGAAPPGLPLEDFLSEGGVIAPHLGEAARRRALSALRGLARRGDVIAIEIDPASVDGGAADAVTIVTTAPAHLVGTWETRLGAELVGPGAAAPGGARRLRFLWD
ncbi:MAG: hypothetical protein ACE37J_12760 [Pikeienuella sp.]|uniref:hypothetical protein n=1 Tax=Pikeienuella sp. TaxID=2831957 RepID=UPI00391CCDC8